MVAYGLAVLLIIINLKIAHPDIMQPWYADDEGSLGMFENIEDYFNSLTQAVPERGYYPNPKESILIVHPNNSKAEICFGEHHGFKICMGVCYLRGFIAYDASKWEWMIGWSGVWERKNSMIIKMVVKD